MIDQHANRFHAAAVHREVVRTVGITMKIAGKLSKEIHPNSLGGTKRTMNVPYQKADGCPKYMEQFTFRSESFQWTAELLEVKQLFHRLKAMKAIRMKYSATGASKLVCYLYAD